MELDDYLSRLDSDLQNSFNEIDQSLNSFLGRNSVETFSFCPECGSPLPSDANFCPSCGARISTQTEVQPSQIDHRVSRNDQRGIIFTDLRVLSEKYGVSEKKVLDVLNNAIKASKGVEWLLLDANSAVLDDLWLDYNQLITDFMVENKIPTGIKTPLFIIGGDDVIPIPMVEDPFGSSDNGRIPCDMCYAFSGNFFSDLWDGDRSVTEDMVRNNVSRLPLEDGKLSSSIEKDIAAYFDGCAQYYEGGIPVDGVMMASNVSWLPASRTMSEHLPLVQHANNEEMVFCDMYVCPPVSPDEGATVKPVRKTLKQVGMLLFNLHGCDMEGMSGFYSDDGEAFNIDLLKDTKAKVFNTVACYGARYSGYDRDDSMLLSSFYNRGFLLYAGSLIPVPMTVLEVPDGIEVHEGSGSEHLMPIFCMEQYSGRPAGEAMMAAKLEYFNTFRHFERDDFSLATMMMFSLYGNPMLRMQRNDDVLAAARQMHVLPEIPMKTVLSKLPVRMKKTNRLWGKGTKSDSLLNDIRGAVDSGLDAIHKGIQEDLYNYFGLEPRWLDHIDSYEIQLPGGTSEKGFSYSYIDKSRPYDNRTMVEVDERGQIKRRFTTK